jgi:hypothetical protein
MRIDYVRHFKMLNKAAGQIVEHAKFTIEKDESVPNFFDSSLSSADKNTPSKCFALPTVATRWC